MSDYYDHQDPTPDLDELQQAEPEASCLDVDVKGPVQVHALPARTAIAHNVTVGTTATQILGADQRRARVLVWAYAAAAALYYLGTRPDEVDAGTAARLVAVPNDATLVPHMIEIRHCDAVWVAAVSGTVELSFVAEQWAD